MRHWLNVVVLLVATLLFALTATAQKTGSATVSITAGHGQAASQIARPTIAPTVPSGQSEPDSVAPPIDPEEGHHRLGKGFWISWGIVIASSVADVELTAHCVQLPNCKEQNPLLGSHPSRPQMYGYKGLIDGAGFIMSYKWRREDGNADRDWLVPPVGLAMIFGVTDAIDAKVYVRDLRTAARPALTSALPARSFESVLGRTPSPFRRNFQLSPSTGYARFPFAPQPRLNLFPKTAFANTNKGVLTPKP